MKITWILAAAIAALAVLAVLTSFGSGPSDSDITRALKAHLTELNGKRHVQVTVTNSKCKKAPNAGDAWSCDFDVDTNGVPYLGLVTPARSQCLAKENDGWTLETADKCH